MSKWGMTPMTNHKDAIDVISENIAERIKHHVGNTFNLETSIPGLMFYRQNSPTQCTTCVAEPSIAVVVQGQKMMALSDKSFHFDRYNFLVTSLDLPARVQIKQAENAVPYLGFVLKLDFAVLSELLMRMPIDIKKQKAPSSGMGMGATTPDLLDACFRLIKLLDDEASAPILTPLIKKEIFWRVLNSDQGVRLKNIVSTGSHGLRIAKVIEWLKANFSESYAVEELAERAQMSKSTFHHHFREMTSMSPLQYQKSLKLMEARRLMVGEQIDASNAAYRVGYESPSQFSREYSRFFGNSPKRDVEEQWRLIEGQVQAS